MAPRTAMTTPIATWLLASGSAAAVCGVGANPAASTAVLQAETAG